MKPVTPEDIKNNYIPDNIIEAINELILENFDGTKSRVPLFDIRKNIISWYGENFPSRYLNFEEAYENAGWNVTREYDDFYSKTIAYIFKERK